MGKSRFLVLAGFCVVLLGSLTLDLRAIVYGRVDTMNEYPNVVMLTGITNEPRAVARCTGSLVYHDDSKYVFLTAGHCTDGWNRFSVIVDVGVSFEPEVGKLPDNVTLDITDFVGGGIPVTHPDYGPVGASNPLIDYGFVTFPAEDIEDKWPSVASLDDISLAWLGYIEDQAAGLKKPQKDLSFTIVGYGLTDIVTFPDNNAGGASIDPTTLGTRRIADYNFFLNLRSTLLETSQNPAREHDGACFGDSGGPVFHGDFQVGVVSSGDAQCRATNLTARIDIELAADFVQCAIYPKDGDISTCGFTRFDQ